MVAAFFQIGYHQAVSGGELEKIDLQADPVPGALSHLRDRFGSMRYFMLVRNVSGSTLAQGSLVSLAGDANGLTAVSNITSGSTTHAVTTGLTAGKHNGAIAHVLDVAASAGAAPEGEAAPIRVNTATRIDFEADYPFSAALAVNDDLSIRSTYQVEAAAASDVNSTVMGAVISQDGILDGYYGWVQFFGVCPRVLVKASTGLTAGGQLIADAARIAPAAAGSTYLLMIGKALFTLTSDVVQDFTTVKLACGEMTLSGFSDQDAVA